MTTPVESLFVKQTYLASSTTSTSACAVMGALECAPVGSSTFSSPLVELTTCKTNKHPVKAPGHSTWHVACLHLPQQGML